MTLTTTVGEDPLSRRSVLKSTGILALSGIGLAGRTRAQAAAVPTEQTLYRIRMAGQTSYEQFDREGLFLVTPPLGPTQSQPRDVALVSGDPQAAPEGGAIEFVTNTALKNVLDLGGAPTLNDASVSSGTVQVDDASGRLQAQPMDNQGIALPPGIRAGLQVSIFTPQSGVAASLYEISDGLLDVQFQEGNQIAGTVEFVGISLTGADQAQFVAQFAGVAES